MRPSFRGRCAHYEKTKLLSRLDAAIEFHFGIHTTMASSSLWQRFQRYFLEYRDLDFSLDISRMKFPEGFDRVFDRIGEGLPQTLVIVVSKSGGTKETRNGMLEAEAKFAAKGLQFARHAVAVTGVGSELDKHAEANGWLARFPMPDWIGGRTSVMSAVGLLPMALQGFDIDALLAGAAAMDERTRLPDVAQNAAMLLALMWYHAGNGRGQKDMVVLPYKDRLALFTKYLQQLVMESLGKEKNLARDRTSGHCRIRE